MRSKLLKRIILLDFVLVLLLSHVLGVAELESSEHRVKERRSLNSETFTLQEVLETIVSQINETRFMYFDSILTNTIGPRPYNSSHNMEASKFIAEELNVTQSVFATYQWFTYEGKEIANVIGTLPSANVNNQSKIVVCAHFDTVSDSPGADDNGSGVSLLLEVARVLSQFKFNRTIEFVAFNAEEEGLVGSSYYAQQASQVGEDILLAINVDMVIWDNPDAPPYEKLWIVYQGTVPYEDSERFADLTYETGHAYTTPPIQKISNTNDTYGPIGNWNKSDHASFWQEGIPALWIFEFNGFQNPYLHKPDDSMDAANYNFTLGAQAAQVVAVTIAKLASPLTPPSISVVSPENKTYDTTDIPLTFTADKTVPWMAYSLDGQVNVTITGNITLSDLSDGSHYVVVYANDTVGNMGASSTVYFTIDTTPPVITILSPQNKTYATTSVPLTPTINELTSWIGYSLDNKANVTIVGNTTLLGLSDGSHSLIVYAKDTAGNTGASELIYFSIKTKAKPFPTWIAAAIVITAVVGAALLVYFAKVKKTTEKVKS